MRGKGSDQPGDGDADATETPADGAGDEALTDHPAGAQVQPPAGETTIDQTLELEVVLLAVSAVREVADGIARRVKSCMGGEKGLVLLGDENLLGRLADWRMLTVRMNALETAMNRLLTHDEAPVTETFAAASAGVEALAQLLSYFKADTTYHGRAVALDNSTLYPALAGHLIKADVGRVMIDGTPLAGVAGGEDLISRIERILVLKLQLEPSLVDLPEPAVVADPRSDSPAAGDPPAGDSEGEHTACGNENDQLTEEHRKGEERADGGTALSEPSADARDTRQKPSAERAQLARRVRPLVTAADALLAELSGPKLAELQATSITAQLIENASRAFLLSAKFIKSGGHYRVRRHLFTTLFTGDQLSYSGGTAIGFVLTDLKTMQVADGDALFHSTGNVKFHGSVPSLNSSNVQERRRTPAN